MGQRLLHLVEDMPCEIPPSPRFDAVSSNITKILYSWLFSLNSFDIFLIVLREHLCMSKGPQSNDFSTASYLTPQNPCDDNITAKNRGWFLFSLLTRIAWHEFLGSQFSVLFSSQDEHSFDFLTIKCSLGMLMVVLSLYCKIPIISPPKSSHPPISFAKALQ